MKKGNLRTLLILGILLIIFVFAFKSQVDASENDEFYYKKIGLELSGKITSFEDLFYGHDYGVISVSIKDSNIKEYDERKNLKRFLGVIKNGQADLVFNSISKIKIGDSIVVKNRNYKVFRDSKLIIEKKLTMPPPELILTPFSEIKEIIKL